MNLNPPLHSTVTALGQQSAAPVASQAGVGPQNETIATAARQFEAIFVKTLLETAFKDGFGGMGDSGQADQIKGMWTQQLAEAVTSGNGLGLQQSLVASLGGTPNGGMSTNSLGESHKALRDYARIPVVAAAKLSGLPNTEAPMASSRASQSEALGCFQCPDDFVAKLRPVFEEAAQKLGVSPRILMAQAALETGWGSALPQGAGASSFNLFGIKADVSWSGDSVESLTTEFVNGSAASSSAQFRRYTDYAESVRDYVRFIQEQPRYAAALEHGGSDERYIQAIADAGYATDPEYAARVLQVADSPRLSFLSPTESANDTAI